MNEENTEMSPRNDDDFARARRRRLRIAIATSNGAGAITGALTQVIVSDPTISTLVGTFVAGTTADFMLQAAVARDEHDALHDGELDVLEGDDELADTLELEHVVEQDDEEDDEHVEVVEQDDHQVVEQDDEHHVDGHGHGHDGTAARSQTAAHTHGRRSPDAGHGYARCTTQRQRADHPQWDAPRPQRVTTPHNLRHRHLRRAGQRFVHRYRQRLNGQHH